MTFIVEKNIPIPRLPRRNAVKAKRGSKYPLDAMDVGDSFLVAKIPGSYEGLRGQIRNAATLRGMKIAVRKTKDGVRIWRIT